MTEPDGSPAPPAAETPARSEILRRWLRWAVIAVAVLIVAGAVSLILAAFVPRAWAQAVGRQVEGRISTGIMVGLVYGGIFTFLPLLVLAQAGRRALGWKVKIGLAVAAIVLAVPNLMTLSIVVGTSAAAHAGERILDVQAPGFRYATLWGVGLGALLGLAVVGLVIVFERRGDELKVLRARVHDLQGELDAARPPITTLVSASPEPATSAPVSADPRPIATSADPAEGRADPADGPSTAP